MTRRHLLAALGVAAMAFSPAASAASAAEPNARPTLKMLEVRLAGSVVHVRIRVCDDARTPVTVFARDSRTGVVAATQRFTTGPRRARCTAHSRSWRPAARFLARGNYVVTMWARDRGGRTSASLRTTFLR